MQDPPCPAVLCTHTGTRWKFVMQQLQGLQARGGRGPKIEFWSQATSNYRLRWKWMTSQSQVAIVNLEESKRVCVYRASHLIHCWYMQIAGIVLLVNLLCAINVIIRYSWTVTHSTSDSFFVLFCFFPWALALDFHVVLCAPKGPNSEIF